MVGRIGEGEFRVTVSHPREPLAASPTNAMPSWKIEVRICAENRCVLPGRGRTLMLLLPASISAKLIRRQRTVCDKAVVALFRHRRMPVLFLKRKQGDQILPNELSRYRNADQLRELMLAELEILRDLNGTRSVIAALRLHRYDVVRASCVYADIDLVSL